MCYVYFLSEIHRLRRIHLLGTLRLCTVLALCRQSPSFSLADEMLQRFHVRLLRGEQRLSLEGARLCREARRELGKGEMAGGGQVM